MDYISSEPKLNTVRDWTCWTYIYTYCIVHYSSIANTGLLAKKIYNCFLTIQSTFCTAVRYLQRNTHTHNIKCSTIKYSFNMGILHLLYFLLP